MIVGQDFSKLLHSQQDKKMETCNLILKHEIKVPACALRSRPSFPQI